VRGSVSSRASSGIEGVVDLGGVAAVVAVSAGDVERVDGALTAMESLVEVVDRDVCEPVRRMEAARRGRASELVAGAVVFAELRLIRAASWLSEGGRTAGTGRSGFGACMEACRDWGGGLGIVRNVDEELGGPGGKRQDRHHHSLSQTLADNIVYHYQISPTMGWFI